MTADILIRLFGRERIWRLGRKLYMTARGEVANDIATNGEADLMRLCARAFAERGGAGTFVAFDVGANIGRWTQFLLTVAEGAGVAVRVDLFEPVQGAFERLQQAFAGQARVHLHQTAVSDRCGTAEMFVVGEASGTNSLVSVGGAVETRPVPVTTVAVVMDELSLATVNLLKVDAEGHDCAIIRGMLDKLRARAIEVVQFEYNWRWLATGTSLRTVFDLVADADYSVGRVENGRVELFDWSAEIDRFFERNYVIVRNDLAGSLGAVRMRWNESNLLVVA
jgi:FkbM family methyltransferase